MFHISVYLVHEYSYLLQSGVDVAPQFTHSLPSEKYERKNVLNYSNFFRNWFYNDIWEFFSGKWQSSFVRIYDIFRVDEDVGWMICAFETNNLNSQWFTFNVNLRLICRYPHSHSVPLTRQSSRNSWQYQ